MPCLYSLACHVASGLVRRTLELSQLKEDLKVLTITFEPLTGQGLFDMGIKDGDKGALTVS